jgi:uncharacterized protein
MVVPRRCRRGTESRRSFARLLVSARNSVYTINCRNGLSVKFDWDPRKARKNRARHGVPLELVRSFDFDNAKIVEDDDIDYGETRLVGVGFIRDRIYVVVFVERGDVVRVISLRKADRKEAEEYVEYLQKGW